MLYMISYITLCYIISYALAGFRAMSEEYLRRAEIAARNPTPHPPFGAWVGFGAPGHPVGFDHVA